MELFNSFRSRQLRGKEQKQSSRLLLKKNAKTISHCKRETGGWIKMAQNCLWLTQANTGKPSVQFSSVFTCVSYSKIPHWAEAESRWLSVQRHEKPRKATKCVPLVALVVVLLICCGYERCWRKVVLKCAWLVNIIFVSASNRDVLCWQAGEDVGSFSSPNWIKDEWTEEEMEGGERRKQKSRQTDY